VIAPAQLSFDIVANAVSVALPGVLWALFFLLAWEHPEFAESLGLGRKAFWLLVPGALLASFAILPLAPVSYDWIGVSLAGAIFPLIVGIVALGRYAPPLGRSVARFLALLLVESAVLFSVVVPPVAALADRLGVALRLPSGGGEVLLVAAIVAASSAAVFGGASRSSAVSDRRIAFLFSLTSAVVVLTFAGSSTIPGLGISESFPYYLLPPIAAGAASGVLASRIFRGQEGFALPFAYLAATWGVLLGADLLRQPPLYGHGPAGLYTIGGADVLDLVYLSGLLALGGAYVVHLVLRRGWAPVGDPLPRAEPTLPRQLSEAYRRGAEGQLAESLRGSEAATRAAAAQARQLLEVREPSSNRPWEGLPVPGWVVADQANLTSVEQSGTTDPREGYRGWLTARALTVLARDIGLSRFASIGDRVAAFAIDLALLVVPGMSGLALLLLYTPGGLESAVSSVGFTAAIYGFVALAFLYFGLAEGFIGATVGKTALGICVRDRALRPPRAVPALLRNVSLVPTLALVSVGGAIALAILLKGASVSASVAGVGLPAGLLAVTAIAAFVVGGVALFGSLAVLSIALTWERQRVGDLWAGTWVVRRTSRARPSPAPPPVSPTADRSG
jgi:uncharacterized RDD family membrane protein YckC